MYFSLLALLMLVCPLISMTVDTAVNGAHLDLLLVGKWSVFWMVGTRLLLAGVRQIVQPRFTAQMILGIQGDDVLIVVRELGFANVSIGALGLATLVATGWVAAAALVGGMFYAAAGLGHVMQYHRNRLENVAMATDLYAATVLLGYCVWAVVQPGQPS